MKVRLIYDGQSKQPRIVRNATLRFPPQPLEKISRGDANGDGKLRVGDGVVLVQNIFLKQFTFFDCDDMLDLNDDGALDVTDPALLLRYLFLRGQAPAAPFMPACELDPTVTDLLDCKQSNCGA